MFNHNPSTNNICRSFGYIPCQILGVFTNTRQPNNPHIASSYVSSTVQVGIDSMSTCPTFEKATMSSSIGGMAPITFFTSISRIDINNSDSLERGFVFQKFLKLIKCPSVNPFVVSGGFPNTGQILHHQYVAFLKSVKNLFGNVVVEPRHKPFPSATSGFESPSGSGCAFGLKFSHEFIPFNSFTLNTSEEAVVTSDSDFIYAEVNTEDFAVTANLDMLFKYFMGDN